MISRANAYVMNARVILFGIAHGTAVGHDGWRHGLRPNVLINFLLCVVTRGSFEGRAEDQNIGE